MTTTKTTTIVAVLMVILFVPTTIFASTETTSAEEQRAIDRAAELECSEKRSNLAHEIGGDINNSRMKDVTNSLSEFNTFTQDKKSEFSIVLNTFSYDDEDCVNVTLTSTDVIYVTTNATGYEEQVHFVYDPFSENIREILTFPNVKHTSYDSANWAGYEMKANSAGTTEIYQTISDWEVPQAQEPEAFGCFSEECWVSVWGGIANNHFGTNGIVQTGTDSGIDCPFGCTEEYKGWIEFVGAGNAFCTNFNLDDNDDVQSIVTNDQKTGGSQTQWDASIDNETDDILCTASNIDYDLGDPLFAQYITERPNLGGPTKLAKFSGGILQEGDLYYSGSLKSISTPYQNSWYNDITMANGGVDNITIGSVSFGAFTHTWQSSTNT
jgi:hypothetical protein